MAKSKKRTYQKRRKTRKNIRRRRSLKNRQRKMVGGVQGECPVCMNDTQLFKMKHTLDANYPTEQDESAIDHEMCEECFSRLNPKNCPLCRRNVEQLINTDDNNVVWPVPQRGPPNILAIMNAQLNQMPNVDANGRRWNINSWTKFVRDHAMDYEFYNQFYNELTNLPEEQLRNMYNHIFVYEPQVIRIFLINQFKDFSQRRGQNFNNIKRNPNENNFDKIKSLLAYILVIEVELGQEHYFTRVADLFGW